MSYAVELAQPFVERLQQLPPYLSEWVLDEVDRLAAGPASVSQPPDPPDQMYQVYRFAGPATGPQYTFEIHFQYAQDEQALHLYRLVLQTA